MEVLHGGGEGSGVVVMEVTEEKNKIVRFFLL